MATRAEIILKDLSQSIGVPDLKFDDQNMCTLLIDNIHRITLLANSDSQILLYGILGKLPLDIPKEFPLQLLTANMLLAEVSGPHLGFEPISHSLLLVTALDLNELEPQDLELAIEGMIQNQEHVNKFLADKHIVLEPAA